MRHRTVCFRSSPQYLPDISFDAFFPRSFTTTPFERSSTGRFEAYSCKSASEGHLPSSVQHRELALAFVTHPGRGSSRSRRDSKLRSGPLSSMPYSFVFSLESFSRMNASISGALDRMRSHCSLYSVTGKRPMPYRETPPFSLTFNVRPPLLLLLSWAFSARRSSSSAVTLHSNLGITPVCFQSFSGI